VKFQQVFYLQDNLLTNFYYMIMYACMHPLSSTDSPIPECLLQLLRGGGVEMLTVNAAYHYKNSRDKK